MAPQINCQATAQMWATGNQRNPAIEEVPIDDNGQIPVDDNENVPID
jgi:NADH dehydrogenase FAD-containing subunit